MSKKKKGQLGQKNSKVRSKAFFDLKKAQYVRIARFFQFLAMVLAPAVATVVVNALLVPVPKGTPVPETYNLVVMGLLLMLNFLLGEYFNGKAKKARR